jgi:hypothetical protein
MLQTQFHTDHGAAADENLIHHLGVLACTGITTESHISPN